MRIEVGGRPRCAPQFLALLEGTWFEAGVERPRLELRGRHDVAPAQGRLIREEVVKFSVGADGIAII